MFRWLLVLALLATTVGAARAASGHGVEATLVGVRGQVVVRRITIAPGGTTGWHYHDGELIAAVESGRLTRTLADCSTVETPAGTSFVEPAGRGHVHVGRNLGSEPVVLYVTYLLPSGSPLAHDVADLHCEGRVERP
jgi:quercetin dioxygenase-like cupin family protein